MNISKDDLIDLLSVAAKNQLFQFNGNLYEQVDGVSMGSPLGTLMANAFMCSCTRPLRHHQFADMSYEAHPSIQFTMEVATNDRLPFIGMEIIKIDGSLA